MASKVQLYLFGDQTYDVQSHLRSHLQFRHDPFITSFLTGAYNVIRSEIFDLTPEERDSLPRFTSLDDLLSWRQELGTRQCLSLDMAVTCMYQIAIFMAQTSSAFPTQESRSAGLCTGSLAAAAVGCGSAPSNLISRAIQAVRVAFRTGTHVAATAHRVGVSQDQNESWSVVAPAAAATKAVQQFCDQTILPRTRQPYVSAYSPTSITISGPPETLTQLISDPKYGLRKISKSIPIHGPFHAPHLHSEVDIARILQGLNLKDNAIEAACTQVLSTGSTTIEERSFSSLIEAALRQILLQPIRWDNFLSSLHKWLQASNAESLDIVPVATKAEQIVCNALRHNGICPRLSVTRYEEESLGDQAPSNPDTPKLAIIAMSGRFPGAKDNEAFWNVLNQGLDMHKPAPDLHWDIKTHVDPTGSRKNTSATPFGCWIDDPAVFDARFFNISPREAPQIDPAQRLALMTAYEAIEQAGIVPDATPSTRRDRVGVFYGVTSNDWMETNSAQNIDTYFIPGGNRAFIPGRINYCFKFSGPSYAVDTACSSSLAGIHTACNSLWRGDIDTAIAGGTNVLTNPDFTAGLDRGHFLSRTGNCKTFDDDADGYCRGEGVGTIIIKRLDDALADNDPILGLILGAYTNHSAESESITRPHSGAQRAIFSKILNSAGADPYSVSYVEMHGTGTQAGDAGEMSSVLDTFAPPLDKATAARTNEQPLYLGSAKANIGHGEAASGVASVHKVLLMMQKNTIVPHIGIKGRINRKFPTDLQERNVNIAKQAIPWERSSDPSKPRRVFVNNFSAAGGNTALLIEDAPLKPEPSHQTTDPRGHHLIAVSAKNGTSLQGNLNSLLRFLDSTPDVSLSKLSYTTTARRIHHQHRVMVSATSIEDAMSQIEAAQRDQTGMTRPKSVPKFVFAFTGQGAQYPGMGKQLFETFPMFHAEICRLNQVAQDFGFPAFLPVILSDEQDVGIFAPAAVQLASVSFQMALSKLWAAWGVKPAAVVGHSLGEYAALNAAGVLSDTDTIYLVGKRAELLQAKCERDTHAMLVVRGSVEEIDRALGGIAHEFACINSPTETVLAGTNEQVAVFKDLLAKASLKTTLLKVPYAFHSAQLDPIVEDFKKCAAGVTFSATKTTIICPLDGTVCNGTNIFGPEYLARHSREPVNMFKALSAAKESCVITEQSTVLEVGPHPAVLGMVKSVLGTQIPAHASAQRGKPAVALLSATLKAMYVAGADIRWSKYHSDFQSCHEVIPLPAYSWDLKEYWIQYVNDWSLRKGDPPLVIRDTNTLESTTIHRIVEDSVDSNKGRIIVEANIARADLSPLVQGHEVDGIPLCTPSVYADIALSLGKYLLSRHRPQQDDQLVDVAEMVVSKALILKEGATEQLLQAHTDVDWATDSATIRFMSFDNHNKLQEHSRCELRFKDRRVQQKLQDSSASTKQKMQALRDGITSGSTARFNRPMVYRAIRPLARFHDDYRAIDEVVLNSNTLEASSKLSFDNVKRDGQYHTHPAIIDSLTSSCGFTMNCNDYTDLDQEVYMNHGWSSLQLFEEIDFDKTYTTYTHMIEGDDKLWRGDVTVFDGDKVVASFGGIAIQGVPRRVLKVILSIEAGTKSKKQAGPSSHAPTPAMPVSSVKAAPVNLNGPIPDTGKLTQALNIVAEESGLALSDLTDSTLFADVGIDSLLGLTITARFKEELDIDIEFFECPGVADLKSILGISDASTAEPSTATVSTASSDSSFTPRSSISEMSTPERGHSPKLAAASGLDFQRILAIISDESGVSVGDLTDDTDFADAGIDSLLSLVIVSRFRDELELDIQHESLLLECPTVGDLKRHLVGDEPSSSTTPTLAVNDITVPAETPAPLEKSTEQPTSPVTSLEYAAELEARKTAVDRFVNQYTKGFTAPAPALWTTISRSTAQVVLVTGATGGLGSHLTDQLAQNPDIEMVVCLNREKNVEPYLRQQKAMREKGVRSFDKIRPKLWVLQADSAKPRLGLSSEDYERLASSVTHIIHNAWTMSAKRPLSGFESQFQAMHNLISFSNDVIARRPHGFQFSFQMVSSIGVVGNYGLGNGAERTMVPEEAMTIDTVLPNGYGEAKWGCERMLDATLRQYPFNFRAMVVRLGQIAGSKRCGYWNPMEHFGFLLKSSQTIGALPDVPGSVFWTPVEDIAGTLIDLVLATHEPHPYYHIDNPVGQPWPEMNAVLKDALGIKEMVPFHDWVARVRDAPQKNNPASTLLEFLDSNYLRMSCGGLVLDVTKTLSHSETLSAVGPVSEEVARKYVHIWKEIGFLN